MQPSSNVQPAGPGRARRVIAAAAKAVGLAVVFTFAAGGGAILHLGMGAPRRFVARQVNSILAGTFKGKIVIQQVGTLRLTRIDGVDAEVFDPEGHQVLVLRGVRARFSTLTVLRSMVGKGPMIVRIPELTINGVEASLEENAAGDLGLLGAFDSKTPSTPGGSGTDISIPAITLRHAWVHGHMAAVPVIDADLEDFAGAFTSTPDTTDLDVAHLFVRGRGLPGMNPEGTVVATVKIPADPNGDKKVTAHYDGRAGDIPLLADGSLEGKVASAVVDIPETPAAAINALAPDSLHLGASVSAHAEVHGVLPVLEPELYAHIGDGEITASAIVTLPEKPVTDLTASATLSAKDVDVSLLSEGAPVSKLTATLEATVVSRPAGKVTGTFHLANEVGEIAGQVVPAINAQGDFTESSVKGEARIAERGAPTNVKFTLQPKPGGADSPDQLAFQVDSTVPDLNGVPRAGPIGKGRAHLVAEGRADLHAKTFLASASIELAGIDAKGVQLARGVVTASGEGAFTSPRLVAKILGVEMKAGGYTFPHLSATAKGTPEALDISADLLGDDHAPTVGARARLTHPGDVVVLGTHVDIARRDVKTTTTVDSVRVAGGTVDIHGVKVEGLGDPITATARIFTGGVSVKTRAPDIDLNRVAVLLAREEDAKGHLSFDVDATARKSGVNGHVDAQVHDLSARGIDGAQIKISSVVDGRKVKGEIAANLGKAGKIELEAVDVTLGGAATDAQAWKTATGAVTLDGSVDLKELLAQIPESSRPVEAAAGFVTLEGKASRPVGSGAPLVSLEASTKGLAIQGKQARTKNPDGTVTLGPLPFTLAGMDGTFGVSLAPTTGLTKVSAQITDAHGPFVSLDAGATLPLRKLLADPSRTMALVSDMPLTAKVSVPKRSLDALPPALGKLPVKGDVELVADLGGSARKPKLTVTAKGTNLLAREAARCVLPVDVETKVAYDGEKATIHLGGARGGAEVVGADATVKVSATQALAGGTLAWDASSDVTLTRFPLDVVAPLIERAVSGEVSGKVTLADLHKAASVDAELDLRALALDRATFPKGKVRVTVKDGALTANVRLDQTDGFLEAKATGAMRWGAALAPQLDLHKPIDGSIKSQNFRADAAMPFLQGTFSELDGRVDTDAQIHVVEGGKDGTVKGAVTLRDGTFEVPQLGERFHGLKGKIIMNPWGTVKFEDFAADAPTGHLTLSADAVLKGLALQSADAQVHIAKGQSIPIALEGVPMGRAYGDIKTTAKMAPDGKRLDVTVDIPTLRVDLPQTTGHSVQPLELDKTVRVGVHEKKGGFVGIALAEPVKPRPPSDMVVHAAVKLGQGSQVKRDTTVDVLAHGNIDVMLTDKAHVTGKIDVERGKLELEGKMFIIDHGTVSFVGADPSNPMIVATAYWDAPDATRVYADFSGQVSSGKLNLRSEPALTQDEILSLILFGSSDGSFGAAPPPGQDASTGVKAAGMAGGVVTEGLNKAISGVTSVDISTRVDTSDSENPRPELAVQITKTVSARLGYKLGVPTPGENQDRTELTLDWRFIRNWSLVAVVGDAGSTSLDMVWRKRY